MVQDQAEKLNCYKGASDFEFFGDSVPYDHDFCKLEFTVQNQTEDDYFDCLVNKTNQTLTREACDRFYPIDNLQALDEVKLVLLRRFNCYKEQLGQQVYQEFCRELHSNNNDYYQCLEHYNFPKGVDYCYFEYFNPPFFNSSTGMQGNQSALLNCLES